jgi:hypothetical protein
MSVAKASYLPSSPKMEPHMVEYQVCRAMQPRARCDSVAVVVVHGAGDLLACTKMVGGLTDALAVGWLTCRLTGY